jgi:pyruvate formate lyase activating enzyme
MKEALFWEKGGDTKVQCRLCPKNCAIADGKHGYCRARENHGGTLYSIIYERVTSVAMDPIEKKPLYHFHPGSKILSLGTRGCNFGCLFCQNYGISQEDAPLQEIKKEWAVEAALREGSVGIAYTYNEPFIWYEFVKETAILAREKKLANVLVTNGYVNPEPLEEILPLIDAMNIDIKSANPEFYKKICMGTLEPVLHTVKRSREVTHVEVTNLVIPGYNDSDQDLHTLAAWIADNTGPYTPTHLSAHFPRYRLNAGATPESTLLRAYEIFSKRLKYVYVGNVRLAQGSTTFCRVCGAIQVERAGYQIQIRHMGADGKCKQCGTENNIRT